MVLKDKTTCFDISTALEGDILKDAKRRDFTVNSIFYDFKNGCLFDPCAGADDLAAGILKTAHIKNFFDDPNLMLRGFRG